MKRLVDYKTAAEILGMPIPTLYSKVCRREIPHIRLSSRLVRFDTTILEDWLESHKVEVKPMIKRRTA